MKKNPCWKYTEAGDKCNSMIKTMGENQAWRDMRCGNRIPNQWYKWVQMWRSIRIRLQCLHTLARSPCTGVCMPVGDQFWSPLSEKFHIWVSCQLWLEWGNIAYQWISDNTVRPWRFQLWEYSVIHRDLQWSHRLGRKQYCIWGEQWCSDDISY